MTSVSSGELVQPGWVSSSLGWDVCTATGGAYWWQRRRYL